MLGVDRYRQHLKLGQADGAMFERRFRFVDVDRADKHVIRNGRQQAVEQIKQRQLRVRRGLQDKLDHRA